MSDMNAGHQVRTPRPTSRRKSGGNRAASVVLGAIRQDHEKADAARKVVDRNLMLVLASLLSVTAAFLLAISTSWFNGYITTSSTGNIINPQRLSTHEGVETNDVFRFATRSLQDCLTFTHLTPPWKIHGCLDVHFTSRGRAEFGKLIQEELLGPRESQHFDLQTLPIHSPASIASDKTQLAGRAAWKLIIPFQLKFLMHESNNIKQDWNFIVWVVREQPTLRPGGLAIHSVAMERI